MASVPFDRTGRPRHPDILTPAEWEVLAGVRDGRSNREIAEQRSCDVETIRFHLKNLRRKLGVHSRDELRAFPGRPAAELARAQREEVGHAIREQIPLVELRRALVTDGHRCTDTQTLFYGAREFYVLDPDANEVAIVEFAASRPPYLAKSRDAGGGRVSAGSAMGSQARGTGGKARRAR